MNKIKIIISCLVLAMMVLNSCGNAYEQKQQAIQKCISKSDFQGAHEVLASITPVYSAIDDYEFDKLQMIVYRAEIRYLVDQNDDASWKRAFFLIQEYKNSQNYPPREYEYKLELSRSLMEYALTFEHEETESSIRNYMERLSREIYSRMGESSGFRDDDYTVLIQRADEIASMY